MRITKKRNNGFYKLKAGKEIYGEEDGIRLVQIVGQLEDIEELCEKIVAQPIYQKFIDTGEIHKKDYTEYYVLYNFAEKRIEIYGCEIITCLNVEDYGKTWALTKEELL